MVVGSGLAHGLTAGDWPSGHVRSFAFARVVRWSGHGVWLESFSVRWGVGGLLSRVICMDAWEGQASRLLGMYQKSMFGWVMVLVVMVLVCLINL